MELAVFLLRRIAQALPTLLGVVLVNFCLIHLAPGDAVDVLAGEAGAASPEHLARLRQQFGLDASLPVQLAQYLMRLAQLDLGYSFRNQAPVLDLILGRVPATLLLMGVSFTAALGLGIATGVVASRQVGRPADALISVATLLVYATPIFWVGLMMIVVFSVKLGWLPGSGFETIASGYTGITRALDIARHTIMPALALSLFYMAFYTRLMRASMLQVAGEDFARTARAKGLSERRVSYRHVFPNALLPVVTMAGVQVGAILGGSVLVESVFGWPGLGRLAFEAVLNRDKNLLLGLLLASSALVVVANIVVDLVYGLLDPRVDVA
jgi:peptide/nickel transport system permease protein